jgi:LysM repeat protein
MLIEEARNKQRKKSSGSVSERTVSGGTYTVKKGDNLWTIPKRFGVKRSDFLAANNFDKSSVIYVGQKVVVPGKNGSLDNPSSPNTVSESSTYSSDVLPSGNTYVVKKGDNLWTIPKKLKVKRSDFMAVNGFDASTVLQIGQKVKIPGSEAIPEPATSTTQSEESALFTADEKNENLEVPLVPEAANGNEITETVTELPTSEDPSAITKVEPVTSEAPAAELSHNTYTLDVSDGETLESISLIYSTTPEEIMKYNKSIKSNADLKPGDKLTLPFKE